MAFIVLIACGTWALKQQTCNTNNVQESKPRHVVHRSIYYDLINIMHISRIFHDMEYAYSIVKANNNNYIWVRRKDALEIERT